MTRSLIAAALLVAFPTLASAEDTGRLMYLKDFDPVAIRMLSCADMLAKDGRRLQGLDRKSIAKLSKQYSDAGRAAVVLAALDAASLQAAKIANISFESRDANVLVTNDLRVHEKEAAGLVADIRASGFDISSSCGHAGYLSEAAELNDWFAQNTSVLTKVK